MDGSYGEVGSGKSMVMNLFWESAQELLPQGSIRRVHFHEFMLGVHADLHRSLLVHDACVIKPRNQRTGSLAQGEDGLL